MVYNGLRVSVLVYLAINLIKENKYAICPRIWCVRCEIPISLNWWLKNGKCPDCQGILNKDKKVNYAMNKFINENTILIRGGTVKGDKETKDLHTNYWDMSKKVKNQVKKNFDNFILNRMNELEDFKELKKEEKLKLIHDRGLQRSEKGMYPYFIKEKSGDTNLLPCCGKKSTNEGELTKKRKIKLPVEI